MNDAEQVQDRLRENAAVIAKLEKELALHPSKSTEGALRSLYKLRHTYEQQFRSAAAVDLADVVSYRIFDGDGHPTMALIGRALDSFQALFSVMYSAVTTGRAKDTAHVSVEVASQTAFQFGYTYAGSLGFVFRLPNERLLFGETNLDQAMHDLFALARSGTTEEIRGFAAKFGLAPIRAAYRWVTTLNSATVGIDIEWTRDEMSKGEIVLQPAEIRRLRDNIDATSDIEVTEISTIGILRGFDSTMHTFRIEASDATIRGSVLRDAKIPEHPSIDATYYAGIKTSTKIRYAIDQPESTHYLTFLREVDYQ